MRARVKFKCLILAPCTVTLFSVYCLIYLHIYWLYRAGHLLRPPLQVCLHMCQHSLSALDLPHLHDSEFDGATAHPELQSAVAATVPEKGVHSSPADHPRHGDVDAVVHSRLSRLTQFAAPNAATHQQTVGLNVIEIRW